MQIDKLTERKIKEAAKVVDVISDYYQLRKRGRFYECLCPFHTDHHLGSFKINPKKNTWFCYSCKQGGDAITFIEKIENCNYKEALLRLAKKYCIDVGNVSGMERFAKPKPRPLPPPLPPLYIPREIVKAYKDNSRDTLCNWIRQLPWNKAQKARVEQILWEYAVGHTQDNYTIYWQVTDKGKILNGHLMRYKTDGHRDKDDKYGNTWAHAYLRRRGQLNTEGKEPCYTCFGMHLLNRYPKATVNIVESEKTALLAAINFGNNQRHIWMASCGKSNLDRDHLQPIIDQNRYILLYPDKDGTEEWNEIKDDINYPKMNVYTYYMDTFWKEQDGPKADIGDIIVRMIGDNIRQGKTQVIGDVLKKMINNNPNIKTLVDKLQLEEANGK